MADRWRQPANVTYVGDDPETVWFDGDGTIRRGTTKSVNDEETWERYKEGRLCWKCDEPQEVPNPEVCSLVGCGFEIRRWQRRAMQVEFGGYKDFGPSTSLSDELERLDDTADRMRWDRDPATGIVVPRSV